MRTPALPHARLEPPHAFLEEKAVGEGNSPEETLAGLPPQESDGALVREGEGADGSGSMQSLLAY